MLGRRGLRRRAALRRLRRSAGRVRAHSAVRSEIEGEGSAVQQVLVADDAQLVRHDGGELRHRHFPFHLHQPAGQRHLLSLSSLSLSPACFIAPLPSHCYLADMYASPAVLGPKIEEFGGSSRG
ncbi:PI-PLC X domain-containing protein [Musa troglodytarum]|uniref:PI-PLC X domain-containing protein n=1 Tax=Musa troglodytarum TaxID=320322 RepID=A0A9E7KTP0_9LILI|nr:PI-PLC X domain-containing protein [Musa troglodytarum]